MAFERDEQRFERMPDAETGIYVRASTADGFDAVDIVHRGKHGDGGELTFYALTGDTLAPGACVLCDEPPLYEVEHSAGRSIRLCQACVQGVHDWNDKPRSEYKGLDPIGPTSSGSYLTSDAPAAPGSLAHVDYVNAQRGLLLRAGKARVPMEGVLSELLMQAALMHDTMAAAGRTEGAPFTIWAYEAQQAALIAAGLKEPGAEDGS